MHDAINEDVEADVDDVPMGEPSEEALKKLVNGISSVRGEGGSHGRYLLMISLLNYLKWRKIENLSLKFFSLIPFSVGMA